VARETFILLSGIKTINSDITALDILALLTVVNSKSGRFRNYWMGNMDIKD
jgi:hypothetical protein